VERLLIPVLLVQTRSHGLHRCEGDDGSDSTGVSTDDQAHAHAFNGLCAINPHPDIAQATRCLGIVARYQPLVYSLVSGLLGDVEM
jgi:hypothetical protein